MILHLNKQQFVQAVQFTAQNNEYPSNLCQK